MRPHPIRSSTSTNQAGPLNRTLFGCNKLRLECLAHFLFIFRAGFLQTRRTVWLTTLATGPAAEFRMDGWRRVVGGDDRSEGPEVEILAPFGRILDGGRWQVWGSGFPKIQGGLPRRRLIPAAVWDWGNDAGCKPLPESSAGWPMRFVVICIGHNQGRHVHASVLYSS